MNRLDLLCLTEGVETPSSRFRVGQFLPFWEQFGLNLHLRAGYGSLYNRLTKTKLGFAYKAWCRAKRAAFGLDAFRYDAVFVQRAAIPVTPFPEKIVRRLNANLILDVDDHPYMGAAATPSRRREATFREVAALSSHIICGNTYLKNLVGLHEKTSLIPTVIDTDRYVPQNSVEGSDCLTLGWMGTSGNFFHLQRLVTPLKRLLENPGVCLKLVSNATFEPLADHPSVEQIRWTAATELQLLHSFDVGLMPLEDDPVSRGKCGFKMIQYMAAGVPVLASAVGANIDIFSGSDSGTLVHAGDWRDALEAAAEWTPSERQAMAESGRFHAVANYSVRAVLPKYRDIFEKISA